MSEQSFSLERGGKLIGMEYIYKGVSSGWQNSVS